MAIQSHNTIIFHITKISFFFSQHAKISFALYTNVVFYPIHKSLGLSSLAFLLYLSSNGNLNEFLCVLQRSKQNYALSVIFFSFLWVDGACCELRPLPRPPPFLFHRDRECAPSNAPKPPRKRWDGTKRPLVAAECPWLSARRCSDKLHCRIQVQQHHGQSAAAQGR